MQTCFGEKTYSLKANACADVQANLLPAFEKHEVDARVLKTIRQRQATKATTDNDDA